MSGRWTPAEDARLTELVAAGMPLRRAADALARPYNGVRSRCVRLRLARPHIPRTTLDAAVRDAAERGIPDGVLARRLGLASRRTVGEYRRRLGLPAAGRWPRPFPLT